ncbi:MAG TPA: glycosyltransferase family 87 protein [Blastocatellia bacterium]|nr:glycosyltransferase family 87 protein [Blastocatellia bacterium]
MTLSRRLKIPLLLLALLSGYSGFQLAIHSLKPENVTNKDFLQEYLMARAVLAGVSPYQFLPDLDKQFQTGDKQWRPHASPHTPGLAIFSLPFAFLSYAQAAGIWLLIEILCLFASAFLLFRGLNGSANPLLALLVTWAALGWSHVWEDLIWGQINPVLLLLVVGAWLKLRSGRDWSGGALLGVAISFKLIFWPLALFLVLCRRWSGAIVALAVFAVTNLIAAVAMGWRVVAYYYTDVGPSTAALYRAYAYNISLWSVGWRAFSGTGTPILRGVEAPPIFFSPRLAIITSILLTGAALILGLSASIKAYRYGKASGTVNFDHAYGMMICVCLLLSPLIWPHYFILLAFPMAVIARRLRDLSFPRRQMLLGAIPVLILLIPAFSLEDFIVSFSTAPNIIPNESAIRPDTPVSFAVGLLHLLPTSSALIIPWLISQLSRMSGEERSPAL